MNVGVTLPVFCYPAFIIDVKGLVELERMTQQLENKFNVSLVTRYRGNKILKMMLGGIALITMAKAKRFGKL